MILYYIIITYCVMHCIIYYIITGACIEPGAGIVDCLGLPLALEMRLVLALLTVWHWQWHWQCDWCWHCSLSFWAAPHSLPDCLGTSNCLAAGPLSGPDC